MSNKLKKLISKIFAVLLIVFGLAYVNFQDNTNVSNVSPSEKIETPYAELTEFTFRTNYLRKEHYKKHGKAMGYKSEVEYEQGANKVIGSKDALIKEEHNDGDYVYYIVDTNEIVFLSKDGYIRTYFAPDDGKKYFDRQ